MLRYQCQGGFAFSGDAAACLRLVSTVAVADRQLLYDVAPCLGIASGLGILYELAFATYPASTSKIDNSPCVLTSILLAFLLILMFLAPRDVGMRVGLKVLLPVAYFVMLLAAGQMGERSGASAHSGSGVLAPSVILFIISVICRIVVVFEFCRIDRDCGVRRSSDRHSSG